jgi:methylmalonyl-CoA mutase N-terminal domain/subunit
MHHHNENAEFKTTSEISIPEYLTDLKSESSLSQSLIPGKYPFLRGIHPLMYRQRPWTMRQYAGFGTAKSSNQRYKYLLASGTTGLSVAFDLPTQIGYDSDDPKCAGEVGKTGVAIDTLADMEILFDGIPLDKVSTSMTINSTASILLAMYIVVAQKQGISADKLRGTIQNDILKEYIARGTYIFPPEPSLRLVTDTFAYCKDNVPQWNTISISGYHIREAGSTAAQEIAFTFANAICYVNQALKAGLDIDSFAPKLSFFFNAHNDLFEEIAKFRAARFIWAKIMKEKFAAKDDRSCMLRFHTQTAGSTLTAQQAENNIIRVTLQALSAILGGTQSLHTNSYDEALALPSEKAARIAIRTQQILANESGITSTVDPLAGSFYVEYLTDQLIMRINEYLDKIESMGGALNAIKNGYFQREIHQAAYNYQKAIEKKEAVVVGVNDHVIDETASEDILRVDDSLQHEQISFLNSVKARRDNIAVKSALDKLSECANTNSNLLPSIVECVSAYCSVGEICSRLRALWGEYQEAF